MYLVSLSVVKYLHERYHILYKYKEINCILGIPVPQFSSQLKKLL